MRDWVGSLGVGLDSLQRTKTLGDLCILCTLEPAATLGHPGVSSPEFKSWSMCLVLIILSLLFLEPPTSCSEVQPFMLKGWRDL